jgi:hypothetical protein
MHWTPAALLFINLLFQKCVHLCPEDCKHKNSRGVCRNNKLCIHDNAQLVTVMLSIVTGRVQLLLAVQYCGQFFALFGLIAQSV